VAGFDFSVTSVVTDDALLGLITSIPVKSKQNVEDAAHAIQQLAAQLAPVQTGALRSSVYVSSPAGSDYAEHSGEAESRNPLAFILDEIKPEFVLSLFGSSSDSTYTAVVGVAVNYGLFIEFGTRYMGAKPFMTPSAEVVRTQFIAAMSNVAS
jgi:HK97 gp10 family phage protein